MSNSSLDSPTKKQKQNKWLLAIKRAERLLPWGWHLEFAPGAVDLARGKAYTGTITINSNHAPEHRYYMLLHEIGHAVLYARYDYDKKFQIVSRRKYATLTYKIARVEEEMAAWNAGEEFARENKLPLNERSFRTLRSSALSSYMIWANTRRHPHPDYSRKARMALYAQDIFAP